jgi:flagellar biosynthetic protein FliP
VTSKRLSKTVIIILIVVVVVGWFVPEAGAQPITVPDINLDVGQSDEPEQVVGTLQILFLLTILTLAPAFLVMMTSFTRIVVVLSTQQTPPNQVLIGLALFLTFFTMAPVFQDIKAEAIDPYLAQQITQEEAFEAGSAPLKDFMLRQTREKDLALFVKMSDTPRPQTETDVPMHVLIPAFAISELRIAFEMGFLIYVPFLIIDMVVASTLMSMGMFMVPPIMISLPFKILLFVMVDGWHLIVKSLLESF